ncbi:MAG: membrane protein insertion efficiency factor YidD [Saezia sp.]
MIRAFLIYLVKGYRLFFSPWVGNSCRFEPTCSQYALIALEKHGAAYGVLLIVWRILRCQPWCKGGYDPVPEKFWGKDR